MRDQRNFERYGNGFRPEEDKILKTAFSVQHGKKNYQEKLRDGNSVKRMLEIFLQIVQTKNQTKPMLVGRLSGFERDYELML